MTASEETIFNEALDKRDRAERTAYLDQACGGDPDLRSRVERLLSAYGEGEFLEAPAPGLAAREHAASRENIGARIGPYKLLEVIGEGGMGVVYLAEQVEPVERRVALKLIKSGLDSRQVVARFEAERQALALMDHPNIAKVLDAGTVGQSEVRSRKSEVGEDAAAHRPPISDLRPPSGRPYFVMELVQGTAITKYCDEKHLRLKDRLELMIPVCQAIQHAHQKGIIHRDIKPSNVLVTEYDGRPVPKIIDFGVAKAIQTQARRAGEGNAGRPAETMLGQLVGTLEYMSPEQADLGQPDIDTRSDIYSLGVLLYELLTGATPFDKQQLRMAGLNEMLRVIREDEPPRPSTKVSTSDARASIAAVRETEPARLTKSIRGELDWIVMKALEKDRSRRYESGAEFAADLIRYLNNEPVQAGPPSGAYRLSKYIARHKVPVTAALLILLALLVGTLFSTWEAIRATRAEALAKANEARAIDEQQKARAATASEAQQRGAAEEQTRIVEQQRQRLEENDRINSMVIEQLLGVVRGLPAKSADRHRLLGAALASIGKLGGPDRLRAYERIAEFFIKMNDLPSALDAYAAALLIEPQNVRLRIGQGDTFYRHGDFQQAIGAFTRAAEDAQGDVNTLKTYLPIARRGYAQIKRGAIDQALADFQASYESFPGPTITILRNPYAQHTFSLGSYPDQFSADPRLKPFLRELGNRWVEDQGRSVAVLLGRAEVMGNWGEFEQVQQDCEAAIAAGDEKVWPWYSLAFIAAWRGDQATYRKTCAAMLEKYAVKSTDGEATTTALVCGLSPGALDDYGQAIQVARRAVAQQPNVGNSHLGLSLVLLRTGELDEARAECVKAMKYPYDGAVFWAPYVLAIIEHKRGHLDVARQQLQRAKAANKPARNKMHFRGFLAIEALGREATQLIEPGG